MGNVNTSSIFHKIKVNRSFFSHTKIHAAIVHHHTCRCCCLLFVYIQGELQIYAFVMLRPSVVLSLFICRTTTTAKNQSSAPAKTDSNDLHFIYKQHANSCKLHVVAAASASAEPSQSLIFVNTHTHTRHNTSHFIAFRSFDYRTIGNLFRNSFAKMLTFCLVSGDGEQLESIREAGLRCA